MRLLVIGVLIAQVGMARADRQQAEQLFRQGTAEHDLVKLVACGQAYLDVFNAAPADPSADEQLYNAGVCFEAGKSISAAVQAFDTLRGRFARPALAAHALGRTARLYMKIGVLDRAAALFDEYATKYAGEKDAADALWNAILLRDALGDDAAQIAAAQKYSKLYGAKRKPEVAALMFSLADVYAKQGRPALIAHLRTYLREFGNAGGDDRLLRVYARLGELLLAQACGAPGTDGLCMKLARDRVLPPVVQPPSAQQRQGTRARCGPAGATTYTAIPRDANLVREGVAALAAATRLFARIQNPDPVVRGAYALAQVRLADLDLEAYLAVKFPTNLDFSPTTKSTREASLKRFNGFVETKKKLGEVAKQRYTNVLADKEPVSAVAAASRLGLIAQTFANELGNAPIPTTMRTQTYAKDAIEAYCDLLGDVSEPLEKLAIDSYDLCIKKAGELGVTDDWAKSCLRERAVLAPATFALTAELVPVAPLVLPTYLEAPVFAPVNAPKAVADAFAEVAADKPIAAPDCERLAGTLTAFKRADAHYMAGVVLARCDRAAQAKLAFERALQLQPAFPQASSNLGELAWRTGDVATATTHWQAALAGDPKLPGAHVGMASLGLRKLRAVRGADPKLVTEIRMHAQTAAAMEGRAEPYVQLAILGLEAPGTSDAMIRYYTQLATAIDVRSPYVLVMVAAQRAGQPTALELLEQVGPTSETARLALGLHYLKLRRWDAARTQLALVKTKSYELAIGRGIAARGLADHAAAEARYAEAIALDAARPEAHFDLGVLWKDYTAARATDPAAAKAAFRKAADSFRRAGTAEATLLAGDCDKAIAALGP
ncbi:MAG: hypothetical protein ABI867_12335 [Kofleriaceae bacterium]